MKQGKDFFAETKKIFSLCLDQSQAEHFRCHNYSVSALEGLISIISRAENDLKTKLAEHDKLQTPQQLNTMRDCEEMVQGICLLINQINTNHLFSPQLNNGACLLPSWDFLRYLHSYSAIKVLLSSITWISNTALSDDSLLDELWTAIQPVIEFVIPIANFLAGDQTKLPEMLERVKANMPMVDQKKTNEDVIFRIDVRRLLEIVSQKDIFGVKNCITINLEDSKILETLLNTDELLYHSQIAIFSEANLNQKLSQYRIAGELFLLKILQDLSQSRNEAEILIDLLEIAQICDFDSSRKICKKVKDNRLDVSYLNNKFAIQMFEFLMDTISVKQDAHLLESGLKYLISYWLGHTDPKERNSRIESLKTILEEHQLRFFHIPELYLTCWRKTHNLNLKTISQLLEIEYSEESLHKTIILWLQVFNKITPEVLFDKDTKKVNQIYYSAAVQAFYWIHSKIINFDFSDNILPLSILREIKKIFEENIVYMESFSTKLENSEIWKANYRLFGLLDKELLAQRDYSSIEENIILNYMLEHLSLLKVPLATKLSTREFLALPETVNLLDFGWEASEGKDTVSQRGTSLKVALTQRVYVLIFMKCYYVTGVMPISKENIKRYLNWFNKLEKFALYDLYSVLRLCTVDSIFCTLLMDEVPFKSDWIEKVFLNEENCFSALIKQDMNSFLSFPVNIYHSTKDAPMKYIEHLLKVNQSIIKKVTNSVQDLFDTLSKGSDNDILHAQK